MQFRGPRWPVSRLGPRMCRALLAQFPGREKRTWSKGSPRGRPRARSLGRRQTEADQRELQQAVGLGGGRPVASWPRPWGRRVRPGRDETWPVAGGRGQGRSCRGKGHQLCWVWPGCPRVSLGWPRVALGGLRWTLAALAGFRWPLVALAGFRWPQVALGSLRWPLVALAGFRWPQVASGGLKWPQVDSGGL